MSYLVLARKHRPQTFDEVIGQEHISELLKKAIEGGRIAHSYLFCGPRGIGKTSCARILAKSLNCEKGPTVKPCGKCSPCTEIAKGTSFDVLEIDGASNRGIDEIRTLRENVKFAPSYGRFKIYIVDEVHMLTTEAFNALLKTLEEPPEHVKFIFATTDPNKVPATIVSRCQRFDFKRIRLKVIVEVLEEICKKEKFKIDADALYPIAKAAQGSLRDALSILDQLSAFSERKIASDDVFSMLGLVETQLMFELVDALAARDCTKALETLEQIIEKGKDVRQLSRDLIEHFRNLMIIKVGQKSLSKLVDYPGVIKQMLLVQSESFSLKQILVAINTFIKVQETSRITESVRIPLEIAFAQLTYRDEGAVQSKPAAKKEEKTFSPVEMLKNEKGQVDVGLGPSSNDSPDEEIAEPVEEKNSNMTIEKIKRMWDALTHAVSREKMSTATYLQEGIPVDWNNPKLVIGFPKKCSFQKESLQDAKNIQIVEKIFREKLETDVVLSYEIIEDYTPREEDKEVKEALDTFGGEVVNRWHSD